MILVDTSAWVEFLRDTGSPACVRVDEVLGSELAICDAIQMEVLAGARHESQLVSVNLRG
jgi:predicted nucleic acid-binding protein